MSNPATDKLVAAMFPTQWAQANDPTVRNGSKKRQQLRQRYVWAMALDTFKQANPEARCGNCAHSFVPQTMTETACLLDSDFGGNQMVNPQHVCTRWSEQS